MYNKSFEPYFNPDFSAKQIFIALKALNLCLCHLFSFIAHPNTIFQMLN